MSCKNALKRPLPSSCLASTSIKRLTSLHGPQASSVFQNVCFSTRSVWLSVRESIGLWYRRHVSKILPPHSCVLSCRPVANKRMKGSVCGGVKHEENLVYAQKIWVKLLAKRTTKRTFRALILCQSELMRAHASNVVKIPVIPVRQRMLSSQALFIKYGDTNDP